MELAFPIYYVSKTYDRFKSGYELKRMWVPMLYDLTGYDVGTKAWDSKVPMENIGIILAGHIGHKVANKMGVNAKLGRYSKKLLGVRITL